MRNTPSILVVEDSPDDRAIIGRVFERDKRFTLTFAASGEDAMRHIEGIGAANGKLPSPDVILLDLHLPGMSGAHLLSALRARPGFEHTAVIVLTTSQKSDNPKEHELLRKLGIRDFLTKPSSPKGYDRLLKSIARECAQIAQQRFDRAVTGLHERQIRRYAFERIIGDSPVMRELRRVLQAIIDSPTSSILLTGPSGTGKDLAAKVIHYNSVRCNSPFMNINCSALPEALLESELFGFERGSFTGAESRKPGLLELADGGTVFLDEIGELSLPLQVKLLGFLEEHAFRRIGGAEEISPDVRVIAATNADLRKKVETGAFREDLFFRLMVVPIEMPALVDRKEDIPLLLDFYVKHFAKSFSKRVSGVCREAVEALSAYPWPGNVRELKNAVERAMLFAGGDLLEPSDFLMLGKTACPVKNFRLPPDGVKLDELERDFVMQAIEREGGNQTRAAALLGLNRDQMYYRVTKYDLHAFLKSSAAARLKTGAREEA